MTIKQSIVFCEVSSGIGAGSKIMGSEPGIGPGRQSNRERLKKSVRRSVQKTNNEIWVKKVMRSVKTKLKCIS